MAPVPCTAKSLSGACAEIQRLQARCEETKPYIQLSRREAEALIADHLALMHEVQHARKSITYFLKQARPPSGEGRKSLAPWE